MKKKHLPIPLLIWSYVLMPTTTLWIISIASALFIAMILITLIESAWIDKKRGH
jgi:hypothetical protein